MPAWREQALIQAPLGDVWKLVGDPTRYSRMGRRRGLGHRPRRTGPRPRRSSRSRTVPLSGDQTTIFEVEKLDDLHEIRLRCQSSGYYSRWVLDPRADGDLRRGRDRRRADRRPAPPLLRPPRQALHAQGRRRRDRRRAAPTRARKAGGLGQALGLVPAPRRAETGLRRARASSKRAAGSSRASPSSSREPAEPVPHRLWMDMELGRDPRHLALVVQPGPQRLGEPRPRRRRLIGQRRQPQAGELGQRELVAVGDSAARWSSARAKAGAATTPAAISRRQLARARSALARAPPSGSTGRPEHDVVRPEARSSAARSPAPRDRRAARVPRLRAAELGDQRVRREPRTQPPALARPGERRDAVAGELPVRVGGRGADAASSARARAAAPRARRRSRSRSPAPPTAPRRSRRPRRPRARRCRRRSPRRARLSVAAVEPASIAESPTTRRQATRAPSR